MKKTPLKRKTSTLVRKPLKRASTGQIGANKKPLKKKSKAWKFVKTHLQECDDAVSKEIRERDKVCQFPGCGTTKNLTNSHYIGRQNWNTRFSLRNCLLICTRHHFFDRNVGYEFQKARKEKEGWDGQYTLHMKRLLGEEGFYDLIRESEGEKTRKEAILETQKKYNLRQPVENPQDTPESMGE